MTGRLTLALVLLAAAAPASAATGEAVLVASAASPDISESSGVVVSRVNGGVLWTHNDSGDGAYFFGVGLDGAVKGVWLVRSASAVDWEDMAAGPGWTGKGRYLFLGDIGDNELNRHDCCIYRVPEPVIWPGAASGPGAASTKEAPLLTAEPTLRILVAYPDGPHNAETLLVHPDTGRIYIVTKEENCEAAVFRVLEERQGWTGPHATRRVAVLKLPEVVCGGSISPDGRRVALRGYRSLYTFTLPDGSPDFDEVWKQQPREWKLPAMKQSESVDFTADGGAVFITSEHSPMPIWKLALDGD